jgi:hypothetical protein
MPRLYLFAEGQTEQTFADNVIKPHLFNFGVNLHKPVVIGGGRSYVRMKNRIGHLLSQEKSRDVFFTTMIDLYAIYIDFPGLTEAKMVLIPEKRVEFLEQCFSEDLGDERFLPYIQLHEYETYLFSEPTCFSYFHDHHARQIAALQKIADGHKTPEEIDDGSATAPSKRIIAELPDYAKVVEGPQIAQLIGLDKIRSKCPHFNGWLSKLESLGGRN